MSETKNITQDEINSILAAKTAEQLATAVNAIKDVRGGEYPPDWHARIIQTDVLSEITARVKASGFAPETMSCYDVIDRCAVLGAWIWIKPFPAHVPLQWDTKEEADRKGLHPAKVVIEIHGGGMKDQRIEVTGEEGEIITDTVLSALQGIEWPTEDTWTKGYTS